MKTTLGTTLWLYLGDSIFVGLLLLGTVSLINTIATRLHHSITFHALTTKQLRHAGYFLTVYMIATLACFKFIILMGGPGWNHTIGTGNHGSVQFSTLGEATAAIVTVLGLFRWGKLATAHGIANLGSREPRQGATLPAAKETATP